MWKEIIDSQDTLGFAWGILIGSALGMIIGISVFWILLGIS